MTVFTKDIVGFIVAFVVALSSAALLSARGVLYLFIALGQAHFLISYLYSFKAGKMDRKYFAKFLALLVVVGAICFYVQRQVYLFPVLILITLIPFVFHYFNDELKMATKELKGRLFANLAAVFAFSALVLESMFHPSKIILGTLSLISACCLTLFFLSVKKSTAAAKKPFIILFAIANVGLPIYFAFYKDIGIYQIAGFIILFHYIRWYLHYLFKLRGKELQYYLEAVIWCNLLSFFTFAAFIIAPFSGLSYLFFNPIFFYGWTLVHIFLSFRKEDFHFI